MPHIRSVQLMETIAMQKRVEKLTSYTKHCMWTRIAAIDQGKKMLTKFW